jgi:hypothetical protein
MLPHVRQSTSLVCMTWRQLPVQESAAVDCCFCRQQMTDLDLLYMWTCSLEMGLNSSQLWWSCVSGACGVCCRTSAQHIHPLYCVLFRGPLPGPSLQWHPCVPSGCRPQCGSLVPFPHVPDLHQHGLLKHDHFSNQYPHCSTCFTKGLPKHCRAHDASSDAFILSDVCCWVLGRRLYPGLGRLEGLF